MAGGWEPILQSREKKRKIRLSGHVLGSRPALSRAPTAAGASVEARAGMMRLEAATERS